MNMLINIDVPDIQQAAEFYHQALGLKLVRLMDNDVAELSGGPCPIFLLQKNSATPTSHQAQSTRNYARHWTPVHLDFVVDDLAAAAQRAEAAGAARESECVVWRGSECITFSDPFGHGFCLIHFRHDTYTA